MPLSNNISDIRYFGVLVIALILVAAGGGGAAGYFYAHSGIEERVDTIRTTEYVEVPDTALVAAAADSINAAHQERQTGMLNRINEEARARRGLETEADTLRSVIAALEQKVIDLTRLKVIPLKITRCGLVTVTYDPISGEAEAAVTHRPPVEIETIEITRTIVQKKTNWTTTGILTAGFSLLLYWIL